MIVPIGDEDPESDRDQRRSRPKGFGSSSRGAYARSVIEDASKLYKAFVNIHEMTRFTKAFKRTLPVHMASTNVPSITLGARTSNVLGLGDLPTPNGAPNGPLRYSDFILAKGPSIDVLLPSAADIHEIDEQADAAIAIASDALLALHSDAVSIRTHTLLHWLRVVDVAPVINRPPTDRLRIVHRDTTVLQNRVQELTEAINAKQAEQRSTDARAATILARQATRLAMRQCEMELDWPNAVLRSGFEPPRQTQAVEASTSTASTNARGKRPREASIEREEPVASSSTSFSKRQTRSMAKRRC